MSTAAAQTSYFTDRAREGVLVLQDAPNFDLETYIANYEGSIRLTRLHHIARHSPPLAIDSLAIAIPEAKAGKDPALYQALVQLMVQIDPSNELAILDTDHIARKLIENQRTTDKLVAELRGYKNTLIGESIRMGQNDLGDHYLSLTDYDNALKSYAKMREYCHEPRHIAEMNLKLVFTNIMSQQWLATLTVSHKLESVHVNADFNAKVRPIAQAAIGLAQMATHKYDQAVQRFLDVDPSYATRGAADNPDFSRTVMTPNDIAVYGALCALASKDRHFLQTRVLQHPTFKSMLELEPNMRRAITSFCDARYTQCLSILHSYRVDFLLDIYLCPHVDAIFARIRSRCMIQYLVPFSQVSFAALAAAFPSVNVSARLEDEVVEMIKSKQLDAKIDAADKCIVMTPRDSHAQAQKEILELAASTRQALRLQLHRATMCEAGLELSDQRLQKGKRAPVGG